MSKRILLAADPDSGIVTEADPQLQHAWNIPGGLLGTNVKALLNGPSPRESLMRQTVSEFIYTAAHDLKSPLRHLGLMVGMLRDESGVPVAAEPLLDQIEQAVRKANALVQRLQAFAETATQPLQIRPDVNLSELVQSAIAGLNREHVASITLHIAAGLSADCDPSRLCTVLENLLRNAIQFRGPEPLDITVTLECKDGSVLVCVADNGRGIDARDAERLFRPFRRMHPEHISGSGLGLAICQSIISQHQGRIWFDSSHKPGAKFCFEIPTAA
jgi:signal transduction histidine kinase